MERKKIMQLKVKKLDSRATVPTKNNPTDAGFDLYALEDAALRSGETIKIKTGIAMEIPDGYYGQIFERSSLGSKGIARRGGVIDSSYRGEILVCLHNTNLQHIYGHSPHLESSVYTVAAGDKIAQIVILPVPQMEIVEVNELSESDRGDKGFGSSGR